ncbi:MAG TPA: hypothetical protein V6D27_04810 [Vampirovibrionales bacterium]
MPSFPSSELSYDEGEMGAEGRSPGATRMPFRVMWFKERADRSVAKPF